MSLRVTGSIFGVTECVTDSVTVVDLRSLRLGFQAPHSLREQDRLWRLA
jgi:hypothetical protein